MLKDNLKQLLGSYYVFYTKAAGFHWNVEGSDFPQYHDFLGKLYQEVYEQIDVVAELCRQLDSYAPGSLARMLELSIVQEQLQIPKARLMFAELLADNERILAFLKQMFHVAEEEDQQGIADFIAGRIDAHAKHSWMLRSTLKSERE